MKDMQTTIPSPIGPLRLTVADDGALTRIDFGAGDTADDPRFDRVSTQLDEYFSGQRTAFDLPLRPRGGAFEQLVWAELMRIPYGETISYGELARRVGRPGSARAVGAANGSNPISIIVPCHRVIGSNGKLTGYGGGLPRKAWLIDHEAGHGPGQLALAPAALTAVR
jgi:methylated-DNA-[protein]-cysteine S-methyltransferase